MRHHLPKHALLFSAFAAAAIVGMMAFYVASKGGFDVAVPELPQAPAYEPTLDPARLMPPEEEGVSLYLDADHDLLLRYPSEIVPILDRARMAKLGYIPTCDPDHALVCFPYDPPEYEGTNFESAAFSIHLRDDLETEAECMAVQPAERGDGAVLLGETVFSSFSFGDAAMSHRLDGWNYRAFREGDCYELATRIASSAFEVWEPGSVREFTLADQAKVRAGLEKILKSFRFQADLERL